MTDHTKAQSFRTRIEHLSPVQAEWLAKQLGVAQSSNTQSARLAVCIAARADSLLNTNDVREFARERLPAYMLPQNITLVDELPRTTTGKLDRAALKSLEVTPEITTGEGYVEAQTETQKLLSAIWCDVLGLDEVGIHDDFFEVGGDSLMSIRVLSRVSKAGLKLEPEQFFDYPTIAGQANLADKLLPGVDEEVVPSSPSTAQPFPLANLNADELAGLSDMLDEVDDDPV